MIANHDALATFVPNAQFVAHSLILCQMKYMSCVKHCKDGDNKDLLYYPDRHTTKLSNCRHRRLAPLVL